MSSKPQDGPWATSPFHHEAPSFSPSSSDSTPTAMAQAQEPHHLCTKQYRSGSALPLSPGDICSILTEQRSLHPALSKTCHFSQLRCYTVLKWVQHLPLDDGVLSGMSLSSTVSLSAMDVSVLPWTIAASPDDSVLWKISMSSMMSLSSMDISVLPWRPVSSYWCQCLPWTSVSYSGFQCPPMDVILLPSASMSSHNISVPPPSQEPLSCLWIFASCSTP